MKFKVNKGIVTAMDAFARFDVELALEVVHDDKTVDLKYGTALR